MSTEAKPAAMQQIIEALSVAVRQNSHDMVMTGPEVRQCEFALSAARAMQVQAAPTPLAVGRFHMWPGDEDSEPDWEWFDRNIECNAGCVDAVILKQSDFDALLSASPAVSALKVEAVQEAPATEDQQPDRLEQIIDAFIEDYEMVGEVEDGRDARYQPSEGERVLLKDAILGLLADSDWDTEWGRLIAQRARELAAAPIQQASGIPVGETRFEGWYASSNIGGVKRAGGLLHNKQDMRDAYAAGHEEGWQAAAAPKPEALEAAPSTDTSYPEGFDASCGLSAHAMRTANGVMASVIGKREWDVPMVAAALQSFAALSGVAAPAGATEAMVDAAHALDPCTPRENVREMLEAALAVAAPAGGTAGVRVPVEAMPAARALIELFRENEIPMSDRNSFLYTLIEDAIAGMPPSDGGQQG